MLILLHTCSTALAPLLSAAYKVSKNLLSLFRGSWDVLSALQSHCTAEIEMAPSNVPGLRGIPWPMSWRQTSPAT